MTQSMASVICGTQIENGAIVDMQMEHIQFAQSKTVTAELYRDIEESPNEFHYADGSWFVPHLVE